MKPETTRIANALDKQIQRLRDAGKVACPSREEIERLVDSVLTARGHKPGTVSCLKNPRKNATEEEIIEYCNEKLAGYKRPKSVDFTKELPRLPSGKLIKRELKERYLVSR